MPGSIIEIHYPPFFAISDEETKPPLTTSSIIAVDHSPKYHFFQQLSSAQNLYRSTSYEIAILRCENPPPPSLLDHSPAYFAATESHTYVHKHPEASPGIAVCTCVPARSSSFLQNDSRSESDWYGEGKEQQQEEEDKEEE